MTGKLAYKRNQSFGSRFRCKEHFTLHAALQHCVTLPKLGNELLIHLKNVKLHVSLLTVSALIGLVFVCSYILWQGKGDSLGCGLLKTHP